MAITRSKQAKQMLQDGGMLVKPSKDGKRPGYRRSNYGPQGQTADRGFKGGRAPSSNFTAADNRREQESVTQTRTGTVKVGKTGPGGSKDRRQKVTRDVIDRQKARYNKQFFDRGQLPPVGSRPTDFRTKLNRKRQQGILDFMNRSIAKDLYRSGFLGPDISKRFLGGGVPTTGSFLDELVATYNPNLLENEINLFDEDSIREIGSVLSKTKTGITGAQASALENLRKNIKNREELKEKGMTQSRFEELYPGPKPAPDKDSDPCLGPNPPSYCFIGKKADQTVAAQNAIARNLGGLSPRIAGSIFDFTGMADGGIVDMAREEMFLGGIVKGIKKGLKGATRAIKKVAKSPIGKAALLGAGLGFAGIGPFKGLAGTKLGTGLSSLFKGKASGILDFIKDNPMLAIGGASLLAGAMTPKEEDEFDVEAYYAANRLNPNPDLFPRILGTQFAAADGGRIGYKEGSIESGAMMSEKEMKKLAKSPLYKGFKKMYGIDPSMAKDNPAYDEKFKAFEELFKKGFQDGGRIGFQEGGIFPRLNELSGNVSSAEQMLEQINQRLQSAESSLGEGDMQQSVGQLQAVQAGGNNLFAGRPVLGSFGPVKRIPAIRPAFMRPGNIPGTDVPYTTLRGGSGIAAASYAEGGDVEPVAKKTMPLLDMGGQEMDLRDNGGFVPIGRMEKADDVPARLSKNEFVFTAEAVRNAGDGDVDKGAEVMYNMMKNLEDGGNVSEESQGLEGARRMFQTSKRLEEVL